jgi:hypothetical protein
MCEPEREHLEDQLGSNGIGAPPPLYRAVRFSTYPINSSKLLIYSVEHRAVLECEALVPQILAACEGYKSLEGHAASIARQNAQLDPRAILRALQTFAATGLLQRYSERPSRSASKRGTSARTISTIAVITADRPHLLRRCLDSLVGHCDEFRRRPRILVVDGSRDPEHGQANRAIVAAITAAGYVADFIGASEAAVIRQLVADAGIDPRMLEFALTPGEAGANRNLVLLLTAGERVLMVDDDMVCRPWRHRATQPTLTLTGHVDARDLAFFSTRNAALDAAPPESVDFLGAHSALLGQSLADLLVEWPGPRDLTTACGHLTGAIADGRELLVRVTFSGLAGDGGSYCPYRLLFSRGRWKEILASGADVLEHALRFREVHRIADRYVLTHDASCMAGCMALDNETALPPFLPVGRNEDGVFGALLAAAQPTALFAHLPIGIVHDPERPSTYDDSSIRSASETRLAEFVTAVVRLSDAASIQQCFARRMTRLGDHVAEIAQLESPEFVDFTTRLVLQVRQRDLAHVDRVLSSNADYPDHWKARMAEYGEALVKRLCIPEFFVPIELRGTAAPEATFDAVQAFLRRMAVLLRNWPEVWSVSSGRELARRKWIPASRMDGHKSSTLSSDS